MINRKNAFTFSRLKGPLIKSLRDLMKLAGLTQTMRFISLPRFCNCKICPKGRLIKSLRDLIMLTLRNSKNSQDQVPAIFSRLQGIGVYHVFMSRIILKGIIWVKKLSIILCFLTLPIYLTGCSVVSSKNIIGERIQDDLSDQLDGIWKIDNNDIGYMKYLENGELHIAGVEWKDNKFEVEEMVIILTKCRDKTFINFQDPEISGEAISDYVFAYYSFITEDSLAVWMPKIDMFEKAINEGEIKGEIEKGNYSTSIRSYFKTF